MKPEYEALLDAVIAAAESGNRNGEARKALADYIEVLLEYKWMYEGCSK